jgi:ribosomal protein S18 acetylase RimI-like enzyme
MSVARVTESSGAFQIRQLQAGDAGLLREMLTMFGDAFDDAETYTQKMPDAAYHEGLLASGAFFAIAALKNERVVGGVAGYELPKFERQRKEFYIYDLAVSAAHRRQGVATALIRAVQKLAAHRGAYVIFVQADREDEPAVRLYAKLGVREDVLHFDFQPLP